MSLRRSSRISLPNAEAKESTIAKTITKKRAAEPTEIKTNSIKKPKATPTPSLKASSTKPKKASKAPDEPGFKVPDIPSTPKRKLTTKAPLTPLPTLTPTPSLAKLLRVPDGPSNINSASSPPLDRPVDPHFSNATLTTPHGTQLTAYPFNTSPSSSPSKPTLPPPTSTTGTLLTNAVAHLTTIEPRLAPLIELHPCNVFSPTGLAEQIDPFHSLTSSIISQQVSTAAASSIKSKFLHLFPPGPPSWPDSSTVAATPIETLRSAGLSQRKAEYISGLAAAFSSNTLSASSLLRASDEEVMSQLIAIRGLGKWSVEMFACFGLKRMDVLSTGDLGVQRGMARFYGKDVGKAKKGGKDGKKGGKWKYMSEEEMLERSEVFRPYRSLFMWYMWRVGDVDVGSVLEG
jgi:DNA-3-methyladenine glycosylase II